MNTAVKVAASILSADFTRLAEQIQAVHMADQIHVDVMDGRFVPNISFGAMIVAAARRITPQPLDVHLMIVEPEKHLEAFAAAGASALTVHVEACPHLHRTLQQIKALGLRAGVALNPHSPALLLQEVLHMVDLVLVMTVNPGAGGQAFLPETLSKLRSLQQMRQGLGRSFEISVDGGIDPRSATEAVRAGANVLVAGSAVFGSADPAAAIHALREAALNARPSI